MILLSVILRRRLPSLRAAESEPCGRLTSVPQPGAPRCAVVQTDSPPPAVGSRSPAAAARRERLCIAAITLTCAALYLYGLGPGLACMGDDGYYLMLGK